MQTRRVALTRSTKGLILGRFVRILPDHFCCTEDSPPWLFLTIVPPTDPTGGAGAGAGAGSSGGDGSSSSGKASLPETFDDYLAVFMADLDKRISGDDSRPCSSMTATSLDTQPPTQRLQQ